MSAYEEHRRNPAWGRELSLEFAARLNKDDSFDLKKLADAFRTPDIALAYFEASLVVEHLEDEHGVAGLRTLLLAYAAGATDEQAFEKAFGQNIGAVEASFRAFVAGKYGSLRDAMKDPPKEVADTDMAGLAARAASAPGNFESQLAYGQALVRAGDLTGARPPLERAAALAPEASGEGSPHGLLARIAEDEHDNARAIHEWRALLLWDHQDIDAARRLAALAITAKAPEDEIYAERLVTDLDPFDSASHVALGRALLAKGDATGALLEFQANVALGPANPAEAHGDLAEALIKANRMDEARKEALAALRVAPTYARAQDLLLEATGK
jgi:Flp pilus assembly protein TadD